MPGFWWINDGPSPTEKLDPGIPRDVAARWHFVHRHHDLRSQTLEPGSEALGGASFFLHVAVQSRKKTGDPVGFDSIGNE